MEEKYIIEFKRKMEEEIKSQKESEEYNLYKDFDVDQHVKTYKRYCEVVIDENGKIMYAIPSHQEKAIELACEKLNLNRDELNDLFEKEIKEDDMLSLGDWSEWLCRKAEIIFVWYEQTMIPRYGITPKQLGALRKLRMAGAINFKVPAIQELKDMNLLRKGEQEDE